MILYPNQKFSTQPLMSFDTKNLEGKSTYQENKLSYHALSLDFFWLDIGNEIILKSVSRILTISDGQIQSNWSPQKSFLKSKVPYFKHLTKEPYRVFL